MNIEDIQTFRLAAESNSFRKAADELMLSQPAVSQRIRHLEHQLNVELFTRRGRRVSLAPAGSVFLEFARGLDSHVQTLHDALASLQHASSISIGTPAGAAVWFLPPLLAEFRAHAPDCSAQITILGAAEIREQVAAGTLDVGILYNEHASRSDLAIQPLQSIRLVLCGAAGHPLADVANPSAAEIAQHPFIATTKNTISRKQLDAWASYNNVSIRVLMEVDSYESMGAAARAGLGVAFLAEPAAAGLLSANVLSVIRTPPPELTLEPGLAIHSDSNPSSAGWRFLEVARDTTWSRKVPRLPGPFGASEG